MNGEAPRLTHDHLPVISSTPGNVAVLEAPQESGGQNHHIHVPSVSLPETSTAYGEDGEDVKEVVLTFVKELSTIQAQKTKNGTQEAKDVELAKKHVLADLRQFLRDIHHPALEHINFDEIDAYTMVRKAKEGKRQGSIIKKAEHLRNSKKITDDTFQAFLRALEARKQFVSELKMIGIPQKSAEELYDNRGAALQDRRQAASMVAPSRNEIPLDDVERVDVRMRKDQVWSEIVKIDNDVFHLPGGEKIFESQEYLDLFDEVERAANAVDSEPSEESLAQLEHAKQKFSIFVKGETGKLFTLTPEEVEVGVNPGGVLVQEDKDDHSADAEASSPSIDLSSHKPSSLDTVAQPPDFFIATEAAPSTPLFSAEEMDQIEQKAREHSESVADRALRQLYENNATADFREPAQASAFLSECATVFSVLRVPSFTLSRLSFRDWKKRVLKHVDMRPLPIHTRHVQFALAQIDFIYHFFKSEGALKKMTYRDGMFEADPVGAFSSLSAVRSTHTHASESKKERSGSIADEGLSKAEKEKKDKEVKKEAADAEQTVMKYAEKVGVTPEMIAAIPGFTDLSYGKQLLVLQDYEALAFRKARDSGRKEGESVYSKKHWVKHLTLGLMKQKGIHEEQQRLLREALSETPSFGKTFEHKKAELHAFVMIAQEGPDARLENGVAVPEILSSENLDIQNFLNRHSDVDVERMTEVLRAYNDAAALYALYSRSEVSSVRFGKEQEKDGLTSKWSKKKGFVGTVLRTFTSNTEGVTAGEIAESAAEYEKSKERLLSVMLGKKVGVGDLTEEEYVRKLSALRIIEEADTRVLLRQSVAVGGATESALASMKNDSAAWSMAKEFWANKGKYVALGSVVRIGAGVALGAAAAPIATGLLAALGSAYFRRKREMREILQKQTYEAESGIVAEREVGESIVDYDKVIKGLQMRQDRIIEQIEKTAKDDAAAVGALEERFKSIDREIREYAKRMREEGRYKHLGAKHLREYRDAEFFIARMRKLEERTQSDELSPDQKKLAEKKMVETAILMRELHSRGKIHYGTNGRREVALTTELTMIQQELERVGSGDVSSFTTMLQGWKGENTKILYGGLSVAELRGKTKEELLDIRRNMLEKEKGEIIVRLAEFRDEHEEAKALLRRRDFARYLIVADTYQQVDRAKLENHFGTLLDSQLKDLDERKVKKIKQEAAKGALVAAVSSLVGSSLTHLVREWLVDDAVVSAGAQTVSERSAIPPPLPRAAIEAQMSAAQHSSVPEATVAGETSTSTVPEPVLRMHATRPLPPPVRMEDGEGFVSPPEGARDVARGTAMQGTRSVVRSAMPHDAEVVPIPDVSVQESSIVEPTLAQEVPPDPIEVEIPEVRDGASETSFASDASQYENRMTLENVQSYADGTPEVPLETPLTEEGSEEVSLAEIVEPEEVKIPEISEDGLKNSIHQALEDQHPVKRIIVLPPAEQVAISGQVREEIDGTVKKIFASRFPAFFRAMRADPLEEWNGNLKTGVVGIKNMPAGQFTKSNTSIFLDSHGQAEIRKYISGLRDVTGIQPEKQETVGKYIERALTEKAMAEKYAGGNFLDSPQVKPDYLMLARDAKPVSVEEGVSLQGAWEGKSVSERLVETQKLIPRLIRTDLTGVTDESRLSGVLENLKRHPARLVDMAPGVLKRTVDEDTYAAISRIQDLIRRGQLPPYTNTLKDKLFKDYLEQAYRVRLMQDGPLAIIGRASK